MRLFVAGMAALALSACGHRTNDAGQPTSVREPGRPVLPERVGLRQVVVGKGNIVARGAAGCPDVCESEQVKGTRIQLSAEGAPGFAFVGWSGPCSGTKDCDFLLDGATTVTATFFSGPVLTVVLAGGGTGRVISDPAGLDCGTGCTMAGFAWPMDSYTSGFINLRAVPDPGSRFVGWLDASGSIHPPCISRGERDACGLFSGTVRAVFDAAAPSLPRHYRIVPLERAGTPGYSGLSRVLAIDAGGTPVGRFEVPGGDLPPNQLATALVGGAFADVTPPGREDLVWGALRHTGELTGIDALGNVFGTYGVRTRMAFRRAPDGSVAELGPSAPEVFSSIRATNADGDSVGSVDTPGPSGTRVSQATRFTAAGAEPLPGLADGNSFAVAIAAGGDIAGCATAKSGVLHPVVWRGGLVLDLDEGATQDACAIGLDDAGEVLTARKAGSREAISVVRAGAVQALLPSGLAGARMNAAGQVIASGQLEGHPIESGYLLEAGRMYDVDEMLERQDCSLRAVTAIGDGGHLGAQVTCPEGDLRLRNLWSGFAAILVPVAP